MSRHSKATAFHPVRHDRLLEERDYDPYRSGQKYSEPTLCPQCSAVYQAGRWQWMAPPPVAQAVMCPACRRIADAMPMGFVQLSGPYFLRHQDELMHLLKNEARQEESEHPLERIMACIDESVGILITTTGFHLARRLGDALRHAHQGELDLNYNSAEDTLRVYWRR